MDLSIVLEPGEELEALSSGDSCLLGLGNLLGLFLR